MSVQRRVAPDASGSGSSGGSGGGIGGGGEGAANRTLSTSGNGVFRMARPAALFIPANHTRSIVSTGVFVMRADAVAAATREAITSCTSTRTLAGETSIVMLSASGKVVRMASTKPARSKLATSP